MRCAATVMGEPQNIPVHCNNPAKFGSYCGVHCPTQNAKRRMARHRSKPAREKAALELVVACAREIAEREPTCGSLRFALARYDRIKGGS